MKLPLRTGGGTGRNRALLAAVLGLGLCGSAAVLPASAGIITYNLMSGSPSDIIVTATISGGAFNNATIDFDGGASWTLTLDSGSLTLDSGPPGVLDSFSFGDSSTGPETLSISGGPTLGTLSLTNVLVQSTANPDTTLTGSTPSYGLNTSNVMDSAGYSATPTGGSTKTGTVSNSGTPLTGTITTGMVAPVDFAEGNTIQLGTIPLTVGTTTYTISLKGDTTFEGMSTVPLPSGFWLLAAGLTLLVLFLRQQRPARPGIAALAAACLMVAGGLAPGQASASTLDVTGGGGLDGGELCTSGGFFCPTTGDLTFTGASNPVSGSFTYDSGASELSFSLTLSAPVTFTNGTVSETFEAGTTFTGTDVPVTAPTGAGGTVSATSNATSGAETLYYVTSSSSTQQTLTNSSLLIAALSCQTIGPSQQCGVTLGSAGSSEIPAGSIGSQAYGGVLEFNVSVTPVPLPAAAWLLVSGLGGLFGFGARARQRA